MENLRLTVLIFTLLDIPKTSMTVFLNGNDCYHRYTRAFFKEKNNIWRSLSKGIELPDVLVLAQFTCTILWSLDYIWKIRKPGSCMHELVFQNISQKSTRTFKTTDVLFKLMPSIFIYQKKQETRSKTSLLKNMFMS